MEAESVEPEWTGFLLSEVARAVRAQTDAALEPLGFGSRELGALAFIARRDRVTQLELSRARRMDPATVVGVMDRLEQRKLVARAQDPQDRRRNTLHITAAGRRTLAKAEHAAAEAELQILAPLKSEERTALRRLLHAILTGLPQGEGGPGAAAAGRPG